MVEEQTDKEDIASEFQFTTDVANLSKRSIEVRQSRRRDCIFSELDLGAIDIRQ